MFYKQEDINRIRKEVSCESVLEAAGLEKDTYGKYNCIKHKDIHPSMMYENNKMFKNCLHCWSCGARLDVIETYSTLTGKSFYESVDDLYKYLNGAELEIKGVKLEPKEIKIKPTKEWKPLYFKTIHQCHLDKKFYLDNYLKSRGINYKDVKEFLADNNIELLHNYYKNVNKILIHFKDYDYYVERHIEEKEYYNHGHAQPIYIIGKGGDLYIFEGFFDMLAFVSRLEERDKKENSFICLNSVKNVDKLDFDFINSFENVLDYIDKDGDGRECAKEINKHLDNPMIEAEFTGKDYNEFILNSIC